MNEPHISVPKVSGDELLLTSLRNKIARGKELNLIESDMAILASNAVKGNQYGPLPSEMEVGQTILPEQVKSMIISAIG